MPNSPLPPPTLLYQLGIGHYFSRALDLAARLGVADRLAAGPMDAAALASECDADAAALRRVLRLLASVGVFEETDSGAFGLTPVSDLLRSDAEGSMRSAVQLFAGIDIQDSWKELEYCVRTGRPAFEKLSPGSDAFSFMQDKPEQAAVFDEAMAAFTQTTAKVVAAFYDFSRFSSITDVGGGNGALLLGLLEAFASPKGVVFDMPGPVERARAEIDRRGMGARCEAVSGDFFEAVPAGSDAYVLKHVIHDWDDEKAASILRRVRSVTPEAGTLLLIEGVYPGRIDGSLASRGAAANDVNMLVNTGGRQRSESEFRDLYADAGFRLTGITPTPANVSVIEGSPA